MTTPSPPLDETDVRLLALLLQAPFISFLEMAAEAGAPIPTVRDRVEALERAGILRGFVGIPAPELLGRRAHQITLHATDVSDGLLEDVLSVDPVVAATLSRDGALRVLTFPLEPVPAPPPALLARLGNAPAWEPDPGWWHPLPQRPALTRLDWRLLEALVDDPRAPLGRLAEAAGASRVAVHRRREALLARGALHATPLLDESKAQGRLLFHLHLRFAEPSVLERLEDALPTCTPYALADEPPGVALFCHAATHAEAEAMATIARGVAGARSVRLTIPAATGYAAERVRAWVQEAAARALRQDCA